MTYYESAEGLTITRERAIRECEAHGIDRADLEAEGFWRDLGDREAYDAQAVLSWLGY